MTNGGIHAAARRRRLRPAENTHVVYPSWPFDPPTTTALLRALHHAGGRQRHRRMPASRPPRQGHRFVHGRAERCGSARRCGGAGAQSFVACPTICFTARLHHHHLPMRQEQSRFRLVLLAAFSPLTLTTGPARCEPITTQAAAVRQAARLILRIYPAQAPSQRVSVRHTLHCATTRHHIRSLLDALLRPGCLDILFYIYQKQSRDNDHG